MRSGDLTPWLCESINWCEHSFSRVFNCDQTEFERCNDDSSRHQLAGEPAYRFQQVADFGYLDPLPRFSSSWYVDYRGGRCPKGTKLKFTFVGIVGLPE